MTIAELVRRIEALKEAYPPPAERGEYAVQARLFDLYEAVEPGQLISMFQTEIQRRGAAVRTLERLGYTHDEGAAEWRPPLGEAPDFADEPRDHLTLEIAKLIIREEPDMLGGKFTNPETTARIAAALAVNLGCILAQTLIYGADGLYGKSLRSVFEVVNKNAISTMENALRQPPATKQ